VLGLLLVTLVPGAVELLPSSSRASRLLGWGGDWGGAGEEAGYAKNEGSSWVPVAQSPVSDSPQWRPRGSAEVGRPTAGAQ
jgi:hypothetical protein